MNRFLKFFGLLFLVISCGNQSAHSNAEQEQQAYNETQVDDVYTVGNQPGDHKGTIVINNEQFKSMVWDYAANPNEWKYLGDKPAIIDFYANWCGPCRIASPILDELAKDYDGQIYVFKIDTDQEKELSAVFGIQGLPSFLLIPMEGKPSMSSGIGRTKEETMAMFKEMVDNVLLAKDKDKM